MSGLFACGEGYSNQGNTNSFAIAPVFREYYEQVGAESVLGKPISPPIQEENFIYQYTVNAVLVKATNIERQSDVLISPVGLDLNLPQYRNKAPIVEGAYYVNNIAVYKDFVALYQRLGGESRVGQPLTPLRYNPLKKRYEQLFEGVGFYFNETDPPGTAKLLAYGAWKCQSACLYPVNKDAEVIPPKAIDPHFAAFVEQVGVDYTGFPLSEALQTKNGKIQQVFENLVLVYEPNPSPTIKLLNIPSRLGILPGDYVGKSTDEDLVFFPLSGDKGHNIPRSFVDYLNLHGGLEIAGTPINEASYVGNQTLWQCYENICLEKDGRIEGVYQIHPSSLGLEFLYLNKPETTENQIETTLEIPTTEPLPTQAVKTILAPDTLIHIQINQAHAWVDSNTPQEVQVIVTKDQSPLEGLLPYLIILRPGGDPIRFSMPVTDAQGTSAIQIPAIPAPSGTLISYKVCIEISDNSPICTQGAYPIWSQP
ncbi:MAG: hypothetical protein ACPL3P_08130 [Anaerolineales bacterium]